MKQLKLSKSHIKSYMILFAILLIAAQCEKETPDCHYRISFINGSKRDVYISMTTKEYYDSGFPNPLNSPELDKAEAGKTNRTSLQSRDCLEYNYSTNKLLVFVIDEEVLQKTSWEKVKAERLFLKEYELTTEDLKKLDWKITYSGE